MLASSCLWNKGGEKYEKIEIDSHLFDGVAFSDGMWKGKDEFCIYGAENITDEGYL